MRTQIAQILAEPVTDRKTIFLIRKIVGGSAAELLEKCHTALTILARDVQYRTAEEHLRAHPELRQILKILKIEK